LARALNHLFRRDDNPSAGADLGLTTNCIASCDIDVCGGSSCGISGRDNALGLIGRVPAINLTDGAGTLEGRNLQKRLFKINPASTTAQLPPYSRDDVAHYLSNQIQNPLWDNTYGNMLGFFRKYLYSTSLLEKNVVGKFRILSVQWIG
jgi:hypothetical protein